jgi:RimJ/RimL family protein N-acetyltransferase
MDAGATIGRPRMLTGDRVVLRPIEPADLPRIWELDVADFEVSVLSNAGPIYPLSLSEFEANEAERVSNKARDNLRLLIEVDGDAIGMCVLHAIDHFSRRCELGIAIGRDFWGKGFGQDAVRTLVDYAFEHLNMNKVALRVRADDPRALGAYLKVGFVEEGRLRQHDWVGGAYHDSLVMSVLQEDWKPA